MRVLRIGGALALLLQGCALGLPAATQPLAAPRACQPEELEMLAGNPDGASGETVTFVVVGSIGSERCRIANGSTGARLETVAGHIVATADGTFRLHPTAPDVVDLDPLAAPLRADGARPGQGLIVIFVGNLCVPFPEEQMTVWLIDPKATITFPFTPLGRCDFPNEPVRLRVGLLEPALP